MMVGENPFFVKDGQLCMALKPALPGWLFDDKGNISFTLLGSCRVVYHNPRRLDTFREGETKLEHLSLGLVSGEGVEIQGAIIGAPYAEMVRKGQVKTINARFS